MNNNVILLARGFMSANDLAIAKSLVNADVVMNINNPSLVFSEVAMFFGSRVIDIQGQNYPEISSLIDL